MSCKYYHPGPSGGHCWAQKGAPRVECRGLEGRCEDDRFQPSCEAEAPNPDWQKLVRQAVQHRLEEVAKQEIDACLARIREVLTKEAGRCVGNIVCGVRAVGAQILGPGNTMRVRVDIELPKELHTYEN